MGRYVLTGNDTNTAATTQASISQPASALKRIKIGYVEVGSDASADAAFKSFLQRTTAAGTSTAATPQLRDGADGAASAVAGINHSVEPTYTANAVMLAIAGHQRSTFQWYAAPGAEIIIPLTNNAGIGLLSSVAATPFNQVFCIEFEE